MKKCRKCQKEFTPTKGLVNYCSTKCKCSRDIKSYAHKISDAGIEYNHVNNEYNFIDNKYTKLYFKILNKSSLADYTEKHHVIPRSLGGENNLLNLRKISAREHFLCHYLLTKMIPRNNPDYYKMIKAFMMMKCTSKGHSRYFNSRLYESKRTEFSKSMSKLQMGEDNSQFGTRWMYLNNETKKIKKEEIEHYLTLGWKFGQFEKPHKQKRHVVQKNKIVELCASANNMTLAHRQYIAQYGMVNIKTFISHAKKLNCYKPNQSGKGTKKYKIKTQDILNGIHNTPIKSNNLKDRLIYENILEEKCSECNLKMWNNKKIPLKLIFIDKNNNNYKIENLRLICLNCNDQIK